MRKTFTIALVFVLLAGSANATKQKSNPTDLGSTPAPESLDLNLDDNGVLQKEANGTTSTSIDEKQFSELQKSKPKDDDAEPGKFQLKPSFDFVEDDTDMSRNRPDSEQVKLHLNYNF